METTKSFNHSPIENPENLFLAVRGIHNYYLELLNDNDGKLLIISAHNFLNNPNREFERKVFDKLSKEEAKRIRCITSCEDIEARAKMILSPFNLIHKIKGNTLTERELKVKNWIINSIKEIIIDFE